MGFEPFHFPYLPLQQGSEIGDVARELPLGLRRPIVDELFHAIGFLNEPGRFGLGLAHDIFGLTGGLFLGIDHTAIVVEDTDRAIRFYRDLLGMKVTGRSENYGREQERLNNVFGARLRITSLHAGEGLGIELLEYLSPSTGKPYPNDTRANDL